MQEFDFSEWIEAQSWLVNRAFEEKKRNWELTNGLATKNQINFLNSIIEQTHLTDEQLKYYELELTELRFEEVSKLRKELLQIQSEQDINFHPKKRFLHLVKLV